MTTLSDRSEEKVSRGKAPAADGAVYWEAWDSPFGEITISCSAKGVRQVELPNGKVHANGNGASRKAERGMQAAKLVRAGKSQDAAAQLARQAVAELREYAAGRRQRFSVPLDLEGTSFQRKVWKALCAIPYGETRSYQQIARAVGNPRASRAVGMANHWNPVAIIVPCHRVIASDGTLGGYGGGLELKARMLRMEQTAR